MANPRDALVFVDNHDNQRGHGGGGSVITFKVKDHCNDNILHIELNIVISTTWLIRVWNVKYITQYNIYRGLGSNKLTTIL